jgi:hypothetical protein
MRGRCHCLGQGSGQAVELSQSVGVVELVEVEVIEQQAPAEYLFTVP